MARSLSGSLRGAAAVKNLADIRAEIQEEQLRVAKEKKRIRDTTDLVVAELQQRLSPMAYQLWWESAPDDNAGFLSAGQKKLAELIYQECNPPSNPSRAT